MENLGELIVGLGADVRGLRDDLAKGKREVGGFEKDVEKSTKRVSGFFGGLKGMIIGLAGTAGLGLLARSIINTTSQFENMTITLDTLTKGKGVETFEALNAWAMKMPVNTEKAIQSFTLFRAMGLDPTIEDMTTLVDTTSALGGASDTLEGIVRAIGQISAKGKPAAQELMQLAERGVPVFQILQEKLGLTAAQVTNIGTSGVSASEAIKALMEGLKERFGGASEKLMSTWSGMIESLKSTWKEFIRQVMNSGPFQVLKNVLKSIVDWASSPEGMGKLHRAAYDVAQSFLSFAHVMVQTAPIIVNAVQWVWRIFVGAFASIQLGAVAIMKLAQGIATAMAVLTEASPSGKDEVTLKFLQYADTMGEGAKDMTAAFKETAAVLDSLSKSQGVSKDLQAQLDAWKALIELMQKQPYVPFSEAKGVEATGLGSNGEPLDDPAKEAADAKKEAMDRANDMYSQAYANQLADQDRALYLEEERYRQNADELNLLRDQGLIDQETHDRGIQAEVANHNANMAELQGVGLHQWKNYFDENNKLLANWKFAMATTFLQEAPMIVADGLAALISTGRLAKGSLDKAFGQLAASMIKPIGMMVVQKGIGTVALGIADMAIPGLQAIGAQEVAAGTKTIGMGMGILTVASLLGGSWSGLASSSGGGGGGNDWKGKKDKTSEVESEDERLYNRGKLVVDISRSKGVTAVVRDLGEFTRDLLTEMDFLKGTGLELEVVGG